MKHEISVIHESLVNGQRRQMVEQIDEYGVYDFWADYKEFLSDMLRLGDFGIYSRSRLEAFNFLADAIISYTRIKNR